MDEILKGREVIFELYTVGAYTKATAIDVASMTEASTQGPAGASDAVLQEAAMRKLEFVMRKKGLIE